MGSLNGTAYPVVPPKVEYSLTPLGRTLIERLRAICKWADEGNHPDTKCHRPSVLLDDIEKPLLQLLANYVGWPWPRLREQDDELVTPDSGNHVNCPTVVLRGGGAGYSTSNVSRDPPSPFCCADASARPRWS